MSKKNWWQILYVLMVSVLLSGCSLLEGLLFAKTSVPEFSFSGYVYADGKALEGATVDCGISSTETNESGYFKFTGINKVVQVTASKEGYLFGADLVFVSSISSDVNFRGYKLFDKSGVVKNNNVVVSGVDITATSENGEFKTKSNDYGEFYLPNLAGQVKVTAEKSGFNFFKQSFTIDKEDGVTISGITDISGKINIDTKDASPSDFILKVNGLKTKIEDDFTFVASSVEPGSTISLACDDYYISNANRILDSELQEIIFDCKKYYDLTGSVYCGNTKLSGVVIKCGNKEVRSSDGTFTFTKLYGEHNISATSDGYTIANVTASVSNNNIQLSATTKVSGRVNLDIGQNTSEVTLTCNGNNIIMDNMGRFALNDIKFGDKVLVSSESYFCPQEIEINNRENIVIDCKKYYDLDLCVFADSEGLDDVSVVIADKQLKTNSEGILQITNLYGDYTFQVSKDGYKFNNSYSCNYFSRELEIVGYQLYNVLGTVKSGDIALNNAKVTFNNSTIDVLSDGTFQLNNIYGNPQITITCDNYNPLTITLSKDNTSVLVGLSYNISGVVSCGSNYIADVIVTANDITTKTNSLGKFEITNLYGENNITYFKEWYTFDNTTISHSDELNISGTYSLQGGVSKKGDNEEMEVLNNFKILLVNKDTNETLSTYTDDNGFYSFTGLTGEYALLYDMDSTLALKPSHYNVFTGGNYDFSNNGYSFGGVITCGNTPLSDVVVTIGNVKTTTNKDGVYFFGLVTKEGTITLEKEGYTFTPVGHSGRVNDKYDEKLDINYSATYKVDGVIKSGTFGIAGVSVTIGTATTITDINGKFSIDGLTDSNDIALSLNNYKFSGVSVISGYSKLEYIATFDVVATVVSGDILISNAEVLVNNKFTNLYSNELGIANIQNLSLGDTVTFKLDGFSINSYVLNEYTESINLTATYRVAGRVSNCGIPLNGVKVSILNLDKFVMTNENGSFEITDIAGNQTLVFELAGYNFDNLNISGADNLNVMSKFDVEGTIKIGGKIALGGVTVTAGSHTATTDKYGKFKIIGLTTSTLFVFEKEGYDFGEDIEVSSPSPLNICATYKVSGKVKSGDTILSGATITTTSGKSVESDDEGKFEITGLDSATTITIAIDGYNPKTIDVEGYTPQIIANLDYDVVLSFSGLNSASDYSKITIKINNSKVEVCNESVYTLRGLKGETLIALSKDNCHFEPTNENNEFVVTRSDTKNITIVKLYSITGTVKTSNGLAVAYATVYAGKSKTIADKDGKYSFEGLSGTPKLKAVLPYYNPTSGQEEVGVIVKEEGNYNITISVDKFAINFLKYAYDNLRHANSYQIFGGGSVVANTPIGKQTQSVALMYKQDALGNKIFENKNKGSEIMGIDPNVSLLSYFYTENGTRKVKYQQIKGAGNFSGDYANYTNAWSDTKDASWYRENYGVDADGFSPYVINKSTITSVKDLTLSGDIYSFTLTLTTDGSADNYYKKLMKKMCDSQDPGNFDSIKLTYTITIDGLLRTMQIDENYNVSKGSISVPISARINYRFIINSLTEKISDIDTTSPQTVLNSIKKGEETPVETNTLNIRNTQKIDLIFFKKEEMFV